MDGLRSRVSFVLKHPIPGVRHGVLRRSSDISLDTIAKHVSAMDPVIVEAGACDGVDTTRLASRFPTGFIHAFEPVPSSAEVVRQKIAGLSNVSFYPIALSTFEGSASIHVSEGVDGASRPEASSLLAPRDHLTEWPTLQFSFDITVPCITLDAWAASVDVRRVDLMWLDLQGMELDVLKASPRTVSSTQAIYLEVFRRPLYEGAPLFDEVRHWLSGQGFKLKVNRVSRVIGNALFVRESSR